MRIASRSTGTLRRRLSSLIENGRREDRVAGAPRRLPLIWSTEAYTNSHMIGHSADRATGNRTGRAPRVSPSRASIGTCVPGASSRQGANCLAPTPGRPPRRPLGRPRAASVERHFRHDPRPRIGHGKATVGGRRSRSRNDPRAVPIARTGTSRGRTWDCPGGWPTAAQGRLSNSKELS